MWLHTSRQRKTGCNTFILWDDKPVHSLPFQSLSLVFSPDNNFSSMRHRESSSSINNKIIRMNKNFLHNQLNLVLFLEIYSCVTTTTIIRYQQFHSFVWVFLFSCNNSTSCKVVLLVQCCTRQHLTSLKVNELLLKKSSSLR